MGCRKELAESEKVLVLSHSCVMTEKSESVRILEKFFKEETSV